MRGGKMIKNKFCGDCEYDKQIFLLKSVIQTITAESMDEDISYKRILEIKTYWYNKLYGDLE